jgi:indole-3-glycerol phosphate synthase
MKTAAPDLLSTILAATRRTVEVRAESRPRHVLERAAAHREPRAGRFVEALTKDASFNVIAECKRRSPSAGVLRPDYDPGALVRTYEAAGAAAISILTEPTFFDGALDDLERARRSTELPLLRKDFIVDDYQLLEARAAGADAILLIVAALRDAELTRLIIEADALELAALVEVHDEAELERALRAGARLLGVNNRNLKTLEVSRAVAERLFEAIPADCIAVAESGLRTGADLATLRSLGYDAFLVGEHLMRTPDPGTALKLLMASAVAAEESHGRAGQSTVKPS